MKPRSSGVTVSGPKQTFKGCSGGLGAAKARPHRALRTTEAAGLRPTALRCSGSWPVAELAAFASLTALKQPRRVSSRSALTRAAMNPALLGASHARSALRGRAFAVGGLRFAATYPSDEGLS